MFRRLFFTPRTPRVLHASARPTPGMLALAAATALTLSFAPAQPTKAEQAQADMQATSKATTQEIMLQAYQALAYLLPASAASYADGEVRQGELVQDALTQLRAAGDALASHAGGEDTEYQLLARSFDLTVNDVAAALEGGIPSYAWFLMLDLTEYCTACHQKLPGEIGPMFSQKLLARIDTSMFERDEMARLYVALRQFDRAQTTFERLLMRPDLHPVDADLDGLLIEYLTLSLSSEPDTRRADGFLRGYADRRDMPYYLKRRIADWRERLAELETLEDDTVSLASAKALFDRATTLKQVPYDRAGAIDDILAARQLRALIAADAIEMPEDRQAVYYMLGLIHLRTLEPRPAVPEMELSFEAAILAAPWTETARAAYALLEEFGYVEDRLLAYGDGFDAGGIALIDMEALRALTGIAEPVDAR